MADHAQREAMDRAIVEQRRSDVKKLRFSLLQLAHESLVKCNEEPTPQKMIEWADMLKDYVERV